MNVSAYGYTPEMTCRRCGGDVVYTETQVGWEDDDTMSVTIRMSCTNPNCGRTQYAYGRAVMDWEDFEIAGDPSEFFEVDYNRKPRSRRGIQRRPSNKRFSARKR